MGGEGRASMKKYGKELILDIYNCDSSLFTRRSIRRFMKQLCEILDMQREDLHFWDDLYSLKKERETDPNLVGTSAIQFIKTSNITIHTLDILKRVYLNIFSCKEYDAKKAKKFCCKYFNGKIINERTIKRI